jgi:CRISPR-associated RAMP protein, Cmr1 family
MIKFEVITPIIISGIDKNKVELRSSSIKGMLRWWFRFYKSSFLNVDKLRKFENEVFGSTENGCLFYMRILNFPQNIGDAYLCMNDKRKKGQNGARNDYYKIKRPAYLPNQNFEISFKFFPHFKYQNELENSLMLLSLFGGIGARWRRGFGSVQIEDFSYKGKNFEELANELKNKIEDLKEVQVKDNEKLNDFMNITNTKIYLIKPKNEFWNKWDSAMNDLRDNFYRKMKNQLKTNRIAYKTYGDREVLPLIIQIKKLEKGNYFGVILVWEKWNGFGEFEKFLRGLENYEIKEVKI